MLNPRCFNEINCKNKAHKSWTLTLVAYKNYNCGFKSYSTRNERHTLKTKNNALTKDQANKYFVIDLISF